MATFPTRKSNTLDIFVTNRPGLVNKCIPIPGVWDHKAVYVESTILATYIRTTCLYENYPMVQGRSQQSIKTDNKFH